jgi:hypothetical protein
MPDSEYSLDGRRARAVDLRPVDPWQVLAERVECGVLDQHAWYLEAPIGEQELQKTSSQNGPYAVVRIPTASISSTESAPTNERSPPATREP